MSFSSPNTRYEPPIRTETFYQPAQPSTQSLFLFRPDNSIFISGNTHSLPPDWSIYGSLGLFLAVGLILTLIMLPPFILTMNLNQRGQTMQATISNEGVNHGKSTTYYVDFGYTVAGQDYDVRESVPSSTYYALTVGTSVPIRYLPDSPDQAQLAGAYINDADNPLNLIFVVIGLIGLVSIGTWIPWHIWRTRKLALYGQLVDGVVESASISRSKSRYTLKLKYNFTSPISGQSLARSESRDRTDLGSRGAPGNGMPVKVLFLNDKTYRVM